MSEDTEETLEQIIKEKISADHLLYVSLKYTKTCDVIINLLKRWKIMIDHSIGGLLDEAKKRKIIKIIPEAPKIKVDTVLESFKNNPEIIDALKLYDMFRLIDILKKTKENEFRKGVCLTLTYKGEDVRIDLEKLKEYSEILERFINYTKLFILGK
jgi:hypothetical protein